MKDSPAYGAWNVQIVAAGTGEALPGPVSLRVGAGGCGFYNRFEPGSEFRVGWASEAVVVLVEPGGQQNHR